MIVTPGDFYFFPLLSLSCLSTFLEIGVFRENFLLTVNNSWTIVLQTMVTVNSNSNSNSTFIALNLYLMIDSKTQKAKIRDRNR